MSTNLELSIERYIDAPPDVVYRIWTQRLEEWWCPRPWTTNLVALELRPGGRFSVVMQGPNGESSPEEGVVLEIVPGRRLVFSDAFTVGWIPRKPFMVGIFEFLPEGDGTRYRAAARHWDEQTVQQHEQMGFRAGWTAVAGQLAEIAERGG